VAEFIASIKGLGYRIQMESALFNTTGAMTGVIIIMSVVVLANVIIDRIERRMLAWRPTAEEKDTNF
jgi:NitT/TauT family transport system permease protein